MEEIRHLTPTEIVRELDKYIIGQDDAKRAVAIAIRNRWRRQQLAPEIRDEVAPKNIIMVGPTGVGKTEIARRLSALVGAPFVKVEATKFTEIGYVGRDVESMVRDLLERAIQMVRAELAQLNNEKARKAAEDRILDYLLPAPVPGPVVNTDEAAENQQRYERTREKLRHQLQDGALEDREIEIEVEEKAMPVNILSNVGFDQMEPDLQNFFDKIMPSRSARRKVTVADARKILLQQELDKLIDQDKMIQAAIKRTEQSGIVFLDEIDKVCGGESYGPDVSREGVQRDLLPMVEGTTVNSRHGMVKTDHILFIAAGAFSRNKPSDLMPELQGRFPIRVQLKDLDQEQFCRILTEPKNALTTQQIALLKTEGITLEFTDDAIRTMAEKAFEINRTQQNIGARRLYAVMEKVLEQISYDAPDKADKKYVINADYVNEHLSKATRDEDLNIFGFAAHKTLQKDKK
ncbi:MAG: ATP-dependent protease ATPase subunit HslU [Sedimentisphaerales bacterium]|nr:ATP-dependent protease ATPase subunit HslU [Sedimentisphaerales bacterium]